MITINGVDLGVPGAPGGLPAGVTLKLMDRTLPWAGRKIEVVEIPGMEGGLRVGGQVPAGKLSVTGWWRGASHADAIATRRVLARILMAPELVLRFADYPDCEWVGHLNESSTAKLMDPQWISRRGQLTLDFTIPNPTSRARAETVLDGTAGNPSVGVNLAATGDAPTPVRLEMVNGNTAPLTTIQIQMYVVGAFRVVSTWNGVVPVGGTWASDAELGTITVNGADARSGIAAGSIWDYVWVRPELGAHTLAYNTQGGGNHVLRARFRPRWWG